MAAAPLPSTSHLDKHGYLFGYPIAHSMSPLFHQTIFENIDLKWQQFFLESTDMDLFLKLIRDPKAFGSSVTMPHKLAICQHVDELRDEARLTGACNTIFFRQDGDKRIMVGTNTDVIGIRESFYQNVTSPDDVFHGRPGMVVGGGGAARAALFALKQYVKCKTVYLVNRDKGEVDAAIKWCNDHGYGDGVIHVATAAQAAELEGPGAIVACVPDFPPRTDEEKAARAVIETFLSKPHKGAILEMAYHPSPWTEMAGIAQAQGWQVILGTEAMIYQGLAQSQLWTGKELSELPLEEVKAVIAKKLKESKH